MAGFAGYEFQDIASDFGGPEYNFANDGTRVIRPVQYKPSKMDLDTFVKKYVGYATLDTMDGGGPYLKRVLPHTYAGINYLQGYKSGPYLYCTAVNSIPSVQVHRNSPVFGTPEPGFQRARLLYEATTYDHKEDSDAAMVFQPQTNSKLVVQANPYGGKTVGGHTVPDEATLQRYVTIYPMPFVRTVTIPRAIPKWALEVGDKEFPGATTAGPPVWEGIGKNESGITFETVWHLVPEDCVPWSAIARTLGKVNGWKMPGKFAKFSEETLLLEACKLVPHITPGGILVYDVHYYIKWLPKFDVDETGSISSGIQRGHNWFLRAIGSKTDSKVASLAYRLLTLSGTKDVKGSRIYQSIDFAYLFRPDLIITG